MRRLLRMTARAVRRGLLAAALLAPGACRTAVAPEGSGPSTRPPIQVAVSVPPQAYFVERIGGSRVRVEVMVPPGYSHVDYPLTPRKLMALNGAALYIKVGHPAFEFERQHVDPFLARSPRVRVVDMSRGMRLITAGEGEGGEDADPEHAGGDPHVWVAPESAAVAAENVAAALAAIDPAHAGLYRANLARFLADVARLDRDIRARLAGRRDRKFMVYHPAWGYFARQYGLEQIAIEAEGKEPSAARLMKLIDLARRERVRAIFVQGGFPRKSAEVIADAVGGRVLVADPQDPDWLHNLERVAAALAEALPHA
jgi:zinc transport system substrate-binding protein